MAPQWHFDSGASHHMTLDLSSLSIVEDYKDSDQLSVVNGQALSISHSGMAYLPTPSTTFKLPNVLHVPSLVKPLLTIQKFTFDNNSFIEFWPKCFFFVKD